MSTPLRIEAWDRGAAQAAAKAMFGNSALHTPAAVIAGSHPRAIDYIGQAPVIVLAASAGQLGKLAGVRAMSFAGPPMRLMAERGDKLRDVMSFYGCGFHLRRLLPSVLHPVRWPTIYHLGRLPPSTLSQIIPPIRKDQDVWLRALTAWVNHVRHRCGNPWFLFDWAAPALRTVVRGQERMIDGVADLALSALGDAPVADATFDMRWTLAQAQAATDRWHGRLGRLRAERDTATELGVVFSTRLPYAPFPDEQVKVRGFDFVPLRSCEDLYVEGAAMRHCVATYSPSVVGGSSRIYSVRRDERRVATVEFSIRSGAMVSSVQRQSAKAFELRQIKGPCNARAPSAAVEAASAFLVQARASAPLSRQDRP